MTVFGLVFVVFAGWRIWASPKWWDRLIWVLLTVGVSSNLLVIFVNHGRMPVYGLPSITDDSHVAMVGRSARLFWLCDIIGNEHFRMSIGDLYILSAFVLILVDFSVAFVRSIRRLRDENSV